MTLSPSLAATDSATDTAMFDFQRPRAVATKAVAVALALMLLLPLPLRHLQVLERVRCRWPPLASDGAAAAAEGAPAAALVACGAGWAPGGAVAGIGA